jgi:3-mercaptopyruvate sulfurtransferase SseA
VAEHTSARAALLLQQNGFKDAGALLGGFNAWQTAGGPIESDTPTPEPTKKKK